MERGADPGIRNEVGETPEEWGKRFEKDGAERGVRSRRAISRKKRLEKEWGSSGEGDID